MVEVEPLVDELESHSVASLGWQVVLVLEFEEGKPRSEQLGLFQVCHQFSRGQAEVAVLQVNAWLAFVL